MATQKKNTLQIKEMKGVDRFVKGTARQPDAFNQIKNMFIPNPGEITSLNGVTKLNVSELPNVESISHIKSLETEDEKRLLVFYNPDTSLLPDVDTNITVTSRGAATVTRDLLVQYVAGGGGLSYHIFTGVDIGTTRGSTVSFGGGDPGPRVRCINFYVKSASGTYLWSGSMFRRPDGTFPSEVVIYGAKNDITGVNLTFNYLNVDTATDQIDFGSPHNLVTGTPAVITTDGQIPTATGLTVNQTVYIISVSANVIKLANSYADAVASTAFNFTSQGSGNSYLRVTPLANTLAPQRYSYTTSYDENSSLQGNRTYYFSIAPFAYGASYLECNFADQQDSPHLFSVFLPSGHNKIQMTFWYMPLNPIISTSTDETMERYVVCMGVTPWDMMPVANFDTEELVGEYDGAANPVAKTTVNYSPSSLDVDTGVFTIYPVTQEIPDGTPMKCNTSKVGGLSSTFYYYVVSSFFDGISTAKFKLAISRGGTPIAITSKQILFTCSAANATAGATYTNSGNTYTVVNTIVGQTSVVMSGTKDPASSGTLTKASGSGDATITYSARFDDIGSFQGGAAVVKVGFLPRSMDVAPQQNALDFVSSSTFNSTKVYVRVNASEFGATGTSGITLPNPVASRPKFLGCFSVDTKDVNQNSMIENLVPKYTFTRDITKIPTSPLETSSYLPYEGFSFYPKADLVQNFSFTSSDVSTGADSITIPLHGLSTGTPIQLFTTGTLPTGTGISQGVTLYAIAFGSDAIQLATTYNNAIANTYINITNAGSGSSTVHVVNVEEDTFPIQSRQYGNRLICSNGYNAPFYSNGYILRPALPTYGEETQGFLPIGKFMEIFKTFLCIASDESNPYYQEGNVYYSTADIFNFNDASRVLPVNTFDQSIIKGLNISSQDVTSVGPESYLVIGKDASVFTWSGSTSAAAQAVVKANGLASANAFTRTRFGPVFVGRNNVYLFNTSQEVLPIGDNFQDVFENLTAAQRNSIYCVYHNDQIKIGFCSVDGSEITTELWFKLVYQNGGINKLWSGPHQMKNYNGECVAKQFDGQTDVRFSYLDNNLYLRDDPNSWLNDDQPITRFIEINNLGLSQDHLLKLITDIYLATFIQQDETFDLTFESQDGSQSIVVQTTQQVVGNPKALLQAQIPQRFLARVFNLSIENVSNGPLSIYDLSILFSVLRRRLIP